MNWFKKNLLLILLLISAGKAMGQTGTYQLAYKGGASCTIAIEQQGTHVNADIFAWWHTPSERHGVFAGSGILKNNTCILKGKDDDADCQIELTFAPGKLSAKFNDCMPDNLPEDFSGTFKKITANIPGNYVVITDKAYFYRDTNAKSQLKTYLVKGNKISVDIENIQGKDWIYVNYTNAKSKTTSGYMQWAVFKHQ